MNIDDVIAHCEEQQRIMRTPNATVTFKMPGNRSRQRRRLMPRHGPFGEIVGDMDSYQVVAWQADELLAFLRPLKAKIQSSSHE